MALVARSNPKAEVKPITVYKNNLREDFEQGLLDEGFEFKTNSKGDKCFIHPRIDYIFIICFKDKDYYEVRAYCISEEYDVLRKGKYKGRVSGLEILFNK